MSAAAAEVLLVEDDVALREVVTEGLVMDGITIAVAGNGREALDYLGRSPLPALILLDLRMPVMDGYEFCLEQRTVDRLRPVPVWILSAELDAGPRAAGLQVAGFLRKPIDYHRLLGIVRQYVP